jgi:hypothetical protein
MLMTERDPATDKTHVRALFDLTGRVAVVTGAAGLYGRQIAAALAEAGARTFIASRNLPKLELESARLRAGGLQVEALEVDQSSEESVRRLLARVIELAGGADILVNNAVLRPMHDWSSPAADFAASMEVNATGLFVITRAFGQHMAERGRGSIINIGSIQGEVGPDFTLYEGLDWGILQQPGSPLRRALLCPHLPGANGQRRRSQRRDRLPCFRRRGIRHRGHAGRRRRLYRKIVNHPRK